MAGLGKKLLSAEEAFINTLEVLGENIENGRRKVLILKPYRAYHAYGDMLHYYAMKNLLAYMDSRPETDFLSMIKALKGKRQQEWVNLGGQLMRKNDVDMLRADIGTGKLKTWKDIHGRYDKIWSRYPADKQKHAFGILCELYGTEKLTESEWNAALDKTVDIQNFICDQVYITRKKDYDNYFRQKTYRNEEEMTAAIGKVDENSFIVQIRQETGDFIKMVEEIKKREQHSSLSYNQP